MIPKFRAYDKINSITRYVDMIDFDNKNISFGGDLFDFDEVVLMQSTWLKDKNGVEVFDGDIIKARGKQPAAVFFEDGGYKVTIINSDVRRTTYGLGHLLEKWKFEVIGNIYDNPELLEGE